MLKNIPLVCATVVFLCGCNAILPANESAPARSDATQAAIEAALGEVAAVPQPVQAVTVPDNLPADRVPTRAAEHRFDVNSEATPARAFFMALVDKTPHNIIVHPDVRGQISLMLKRVTVVEVLDVVSEVYGYVYRRTAAGYAIFPATLQSRIFQIDYLNLQRSGVSRTRVSSGQVSEGARSNQGGGAYGGGGTAMPNVGSAEDPQQVSGSRIETNYEADFWSELRTTLELMVGDAPGHKVIVNSQTGVIVVRALPDKLRTVGEYLAATQEIAQRQVVIEAKIIEVQLNDAFRAGINWVAVAQNSGGDTYTFGQLAPPPGFNGDPADLGGGSSRLEPGNPTSGFDLTTLGGAFTMAFDIGDFSSFMELLAVQGDTRVLSSPRVSTLNNQKAVIKAGTDEFFVTDIASNTVTGTSSSTSRNVQLTPFFSGIALDVTPQISARGDVTLHIHPTVSEVTDQIKNLTVSGETDTLPLAVSEIRESDSIVRARSGQIIVIGGLMRNSSSEEDYSTPMLSKIPGLGRLFRSKRTTDRKTELVILLKPIVVDNDAVWTTLAGDALHRIQQTTAQ